MAERHNVVAHIRAHTGERPYKCKFCNYASQTKGNLQSHMKRMHGKKAIFKKKLYATYHVEPLDDDL